MLLAAFGLEGRGTALAAVSVGRLATTARKRPGIRGGHGLEASHVPQGNLLHYVTAASIALGG